MPLTLPPYALPPLAFPFQQLAALAGRAPLGGAREVALACFLAARLAAEQLAPAAASTEVRLARAAAARSWFGTLALPAPVRTALARCADRSAEEAPAALAAELRALADVSAPWLDAGSRGELESLAARFMA